jgi:ubiquinone/menaquinone biosynthesis C-methylase UbiE
MVTSIYNEDTIAHLHRYAIALDFVHDKDVLDIACGEGYGSFLLSKVSHSVTGVDIDESVINHAVDKYKHKGLNFKKGTATAIPLPASSIDVVISFETIEHLKEHDEMLLEIKRVLRPNGLLIMSSPDKKTYSDDRNFTNEYHVKELYYEEFLSLIKKNFKNQQVLFQKYFHGSVILSKTDLSFNKEYRGNYNEINTSDVFSTMLYTIIIASDAEIKINCPNSFFDGSKLVEETIHEIYNSKTYRAGAFVSFPLRLIRSVFK